MEVYTFLKKVHIMHFIIFTISLTISFCRNTYNTLRIRSYARFQPLGKKVGRANTTCLAGVTFTVLIKKLSRSSHLR